MPPVRSTKNQYRGINAHLHSRWQSQGGWDEFHTSHIVYLSTALKAQLLPMGYTTGIEQSLQIRRADAPAGRPRSDVTIYDQNPRRSVKPASSRRLTAPVVAPLPEIVDDIEEMVEYRALAIYQAETTGSERGEPVAWIELLSPSNKPGGQDAYYYRSKRLKLLHSGIVFVEMDYLHESPPTFERLSATDAYRILVVDPRPSFSSGTVYNYPFGVDDDLPEVSIPLSGGDVLEFEFGPPYHRTIEESLFTREQVDYSQLPDDFDRYSRADQVRIVARMLAVLTAARDGLNLEENVPLPVHTIELDHALDQLQNWQ